MSTVKSKAFRMTGMQRMDLNSYGAGQAGDEHSHRVPLYARANPNLPIRKAWKLDGFIHIILNNTSEEPAGVIERVVTSLKAYDAEFLLY